MTIKKLKAALLEIKQFCADTVCARYTKPKKAKRWSSPAIGALTNGRMTNDATH